MNTQPTVLAQLHHLYKNLMCDGVRDSADAKRIAQGLLGPAIEALERGTPATGGEPVGTVVHNTAADAQFAPRAVWPLNNFHDLPLGTKLYTSPQPVREPLSFAQKLDLISDCKGIRGKVIGDGQLFSLIEQVERHYKITGGQHDTE